MMNKSSYFWVAMIIMATQACSSWVADSRDPSEVAHLIEAAATRIDSRDMDVKAKIYRDNIYANHFLTIGNKSFYVQRLKDGGYKNVSDAAARSSALFRAEIMRYLIEGEDGHLEDVFNYLDLLINISEVKGLVVRGAVPRSLDFPKDWEEDKWYHGVGIFDGWDFRSDASPGQFVSVVEAMHLAYWYGPDRFRERAAKNILNIADYLITNDYTIIDKDGEETQISNFWPRWPVILIPMVGDTGYFIKGGFQNRGRRILGLLSILHAAASINISYEKNYQVLLKELGQYIEAAPIGFMGTEGDDLAGFSSYLSILDPNMQGGLEQNPKHFLAAMDKVWKYADFHLPFISVYGYLTGVDITEQLVAALGHLDTWPYPKDRVLIINSSIVELALLAEFGWPLKPLSLVPVELWRGYTSSYAWSRTLRRTDFGSNNRVFSYIDFIEAYYLEKALKKLANSN